MKYLIIGGAGYVGQELVRLLTDKDADVVVLDAFKHGNKASFIERFPEVEYIEADISEGEAVSSTVQRIKPDIIYLLAAIHYIPYCISHPDEVVATNIQGLQNTIDAIKLSVTNARLVFASSAAVYGSPTTKCTEETVSAPNDIYGYSKQMGEWLIRNQLTDYVILRLSNVFGRQDPIPHLIPKTAKFLKSNEPLELGNSVAKRDYVFVDDVASAFVYVASAPSGEIYNVSTGETHDVREVVNTLSKLTGSSSTITFETANNLRAVDADYLCSDNTKLQGLGWKPSVSFEEGLRTAIE